MCSRLKIASKWYVHRFTINFSKKGFNKHTENFVCLFPFKIYRSLSQVLVFWKKRERSDILFKYSIFFYFYIQRLLFVFLFISPNSWNINHKIIFWKVVQYFTDSNKHLYNSKREPRISNLRYLDVHKAKLCPSFVLFQERTNRIPLRIEPCGIHQLSSRIRYCKSRSEDMILASRFLHLGIKIQRWMLRPMDQYCWRIVCWHCWYDLT